MPSAVLPHGPTKPQSLLPQRGDTAARALSVLAQQDRVPDLEWPESLREWFRLPQLRTDPTPYAAPDLVVHPPLPRSHDNEGAVWDLVGLPDDVVALYEDQVANVGPVGSTACMLPPVLQTDTGRLVLFYEVPPAPSPLVSTWVNTPDTWPGYLARDCVDALALYAQMREHMDEWVAFATDLDHRQQVLDGLDRPDRRAARARFTARAEHLTAVRDAYAAADPAYTASLLSPLWRAVDALPRTPGRPVPSSSTAGPWRIHRK